MHTRLFILFFYKHNEGSTVLSAHVYLGEPRPFYAPDAFLAMLLCLDSKPVSDTSVSLREIRVCMWHAYRMAACLLAQCTAAECLLCSRDRSHSNEHEIQPLTNSQQLQKVTWSCHLEDVENRVVGKHHTQVTGCRRTMPQLGDKEERKGSLGAIHFPVCFLVLNLPLGLSLGSAVSSGGLSAGHQWEGLGRSADTAATLRNWLPWRPLRPTASPEWSHGPARLVRQ